MLIKAYCVNVVVDIKHIYLKKQFLFQKKNCYIDKVYSFLHLFDKIYFNFAKINKAFQSYFVYTKLVTKLV